MLITYSPVVGVPTCVAAQYGLGFGLGVSPFGAWVLMLAVELMMILMIMMTMSDTVIEVCVIIAVADVIAVTNV